MSYDKKDLERRMDGAIGSLADRIAGPAHRARLRQSAG